MTDTLPPEGTDTTPAKTFPKDRLRESLLRNAGLSPAQIDEALQTEHETDQQLDQILVAKNFLSEHKCLEMFGELLGLEYIDNLTDNPVNDLINGRDIRTFNPNLR